MGAGWGSGLYTGFRPAYLINKQDTAIGRDHGVCQGSCGCQLINSACSYRYRYLAQAGVVCSTEPEIFLDVSLFFSTMVLEVFCQSLLRRETQLLTTPSSPIASPSESHTAKLRRRSLFIQIRDSRTFCEHMIVTQSPHSKSEKPIPQMSQPDVCRDLLSWDLPGLFWPSSTPKLCQSCNACQTWMVYRIFVGLK